MNNHNEDTQFSPEVHVLASTLRPRCVDQHLVVRRLRGVAQTSSSLGHSKNLPQLNDTHNPLKLSLALHRGRHKTPHNHREMATDNHQLVSMLLYCSKPFRWRQPPRVTRKP